MEKVVGGLMVQQGVQQVSFTDELLGYEPQWSRSQTKPPSMAEVLSVYAPELKEQLATVSAIRSQQLDQLRAELETYPANQSILRRTLRALGAKSSEIDALDQLTTEDIQPFRKAEEDLRRASSELAEFIADKFPIQSDTPRAQPR